MKHSVRCRGFSPVARGTLVGFAVIAIEELHLVVHNIALHRKGEARWAQLPARPILRDGRQVTVEATGKASYVPILSFDDRATASAFSAAVWRAVAETYPEAESAEAGERAYG